MTGRTSPQASFGSSGGGRPLDAGAPAPLYRQLLVSLKERIAAGEFEKQGQLPSEASIERTYGVSRITVRRALQELEQIGLIRRRQGRPTRVLSPCPPAEPGGATLPADLLMIDFRTDSELLEFGTTPAPAEVARRLDLRPGAPVLRTLRLRRTGGRPFCRSLAYLPESVAEGLPRTTLEKDPLPWLLMRGGLAIAEVEQTIGASPAEGALARLLEVPEGAPLLHVERLLRDERQRPVELASIHFRPDAYRYRMTVKGPFAGAPCRTDPTPARS